MQTQGSFSPTYPGRVGSPGRKKGRRTRSDSGGKRVDITHGVGFEEFEHNQWTIEGRIERLAAFARGAGRATGTRSVAAKVLAIAILTPFAVWFVSLLVELLNG
jgi:hypothetical protein